MLTPDSSSTISAIIQSSVAPVFLLAGVAGLLNVFTGRLTRIMDRLEKLDTYMNTQIQKDQYDEENEKHLNRKKFLIKRLTNTNLAIFFCTATGLMVALVILSIFAGALFSFQSKVFVSLFFMLAMFFLILSLMLFLREI
ncbi:MAG: DUF2721 domain-containing protein, partial [Epsilonproteobacteria bacterium]|nr:DUF2721 domain-containing protein [Campylobacterota bacterium]